MLIRVQLAGILLAFAGGGLAMFTRRLPSLLALPAMALAVSAVALVRWELILPALTQSGARGAAAGAGALAREGGLVLAGMAVAIAAVWTAAREAYVRAPEAGRALAFALAGLAAAGELWHGMPRILEASPAAMAVLAAFAVAMGLAGWWALGGAERSDGAPDVAAALVLAAAAFGAGPRLLAPWSLHWFYRGQLHGLVTAAQCLSADAAWILRGVVNDGVLRLAPNYAIIICGSMLAVFLARTGLAREIVKTAAELGGDRPRALAATLLVVIAALFTTLAGLGSIIMVGMIVLPLLMSLEAPAEAAASLLLMGVSLGGILNPANWNLYLEVFHLPRSQVLAFAGPLFVLGLAVALVFIRREFPGAPAAASASEPRFVHLPDERVAKRLPVRVREALRHLLVVQPGGLRPLMVLTPLLPLVLILGCGVPEIPAFLLSLLFGAALYAGPRRTDLLVTSALEGLSGVAPAVVILMGLGMLLKALSLPLAGAAADAPAAVPAIMAPLVRLLVPARPFTYVIAFTLLSPLALYRGPLNVWGMGLGLAEVIRAAGSLGAPLIMAMLQSVGQIQGICDPTNTANIWVAGHARVTTRRILVKTFPYALVMAAGGLALATVLFRHDFVR